MQRFSALLIAAPSSGREVYLSSLHAPALLAEDYLAAAQAWFDQQTKAHRDQTVQVIVNLVARSMSLSEVRDPEVTFIPKEAWRRLDLHEVAAIHDYYRPSVPVLTPNQSKILQALAKATAMVPVMSAAMLALLLPMQAHGLVTINQAARIIKPNAEGEPIEGEGAVTITEQGRAIAVQAPA